MCAKCKVVNVRSYDWKNDPDFVYIGRANPHYGLKGSKFGNPFRSGQDGTLAEVLEKYRVWLWNEMKVGRISHEDLLDLDGKSLGCWCKPKGCHGDVVKRAVEWAVRLEEDSLATAEEGRV